MAKRSQLQEKDLQYIFHPCAQMKDFEETPPLIITKGEGLYLFDETGKKYMDCILVGGLIYLDMQILELMR